MRESPSTARYKARQRRRQEREAATAARDAAAGLNGAREVRPDPLRAAEASKRTRERLKAEHEERAKRRAAKAPPVPEVSKKTEPAA